MLLLSVILLVTISNGESARIFAIFPTPSYSHQMVFQPIWKELSQRHQITVVTPNPLNDPRLKNLTEIDVSRISKQSWVKYNLGTMGTTEETTHGMSIFLDMYYDLAEAQLGSLEVQEFIGNRNHTFDLLIVEHLWPSYFAFKEIFQCPMVGIASLPFSIAQHYSFGNPMNPATFPDPMLATSREMGFFDRLKSTVFYALNRIASLKLQERVNYQVGKHFPDVKKTVGELSREMSIGIQTFNSVLLPQRPNVPAVIDVSGLHIKPPQVLPEKIKSILDSSNNGVVYFSLGSNVKSSSLPKDKLEMLIETFRDLPYDILWKFEVSSTYALPKNVHIFSWLPQQDILRHANVKAFVTQCGLQSVEEAIYAKVPLVGIPFFADQQSVAYRIQDAGIGKKLDFLSLTKEDLHETIVEVLENNMYREKLSSIMEVLADKPMTSLETAVWWIEYVIRHKGAQMLKSPMVDIPLYKYLLLDVIASLIFMFSVSLYIFVKLTKMLLRTKYIL